MDELLDSLLEVPVIEEVNYWPARKYTHEKSYL